MSVTFDLPADLESLLRQECDDLDRIAREALLVELYRGGRISLGRLATLLGIETMATYDWLDKRGVGPNYGVADFEHDLETLDTLFGRKR